MKAVKKGKDGRLYFGKGTQGGLAPQPVKSGVNISNVSIPGLTSPTNFEAPLVGGKYSYADLFKNGFTREEIATIETASPIASRPTYTAQALLMNQLNERTYGETYDRYSAANTVATAMTDKIASVLPLPEDPSERFMRLKDISPIYGRLLAEVTATRYNYNKTEKNNNNSLYSPVFLEFAEKLNNKYGGGDYGALQTGDDGKLYISHDAHDFLRAYKKELESNEYAKKHVDEDLKFYGDMAQKYNYGEKGASPEIAYYHTDKVKPSEQLVAARIEAAYAAKDLRREEDKSGRGFGAVLRGGKKAKSVLEAEGRLKDKTRQRDTLENMSRILDVL